MFFLTNYPFMSTDALEAYLSDKNADGAALLRAFRKAANAAGRDVEERVTKSMISWKRKRAFASAYVKGRYLECSIDLLETVDHPHLKAAFHTTKKVITHRFTLEKGEAVDTRMRAWLKRAYKVVGPGTR